MKNIRIGDIELRKVNHCLVNPDKWYWEIVKWYPNHLYNKQDEFEEISPGRYQNKKDPWYYVSGIEIFNRPQSCYTIYFVEWEGGGERSDEEPDLRSVGRRPYVLDNDNLDSLKEVINFLYKMYDNENN